MGWVSCWLPCGPVVHVTWGFRFVWPCSSSMVVTSMVAWARLRGVLAVCALLLYVVACKARQGKGLLFCAGLGEVRVAEGAGLGLCMGLGCAGLCHSVACQAVCMSWISSRLFRAQQGLVPGLESSKDCPVTARCEHVMLV